MTVNDITPAQLAGYFDHTQLRAYATEADLERLCEECVKYGFAMAAVNPASVTFCKEKLAGSKVHVGAAVGFPLGQNTIETKIFETRDAIEKGADEIDYVINITQLKEKNYAYIEKEMASVTEICREKNVISKVIFENCYLTKDEIAKVAEIAKEVKPDFIKTSTGFGPSGATAEDVKLMKSVVGDEVKVKAAGGIHDVETAMAMVDAGAERIGTSSSIDIVEAYKRKVNA